MTQNSTRLMSRLTIFLSLIGQATFAISPANARGTDIVQTAAFKVSVVSDGKMLTAKHSKTRKNQRMSYKWMLGSAPIIGATARTIPYEVSYCGQPIRVQITIKERGSRVTRVTSQPFNPKECLISTGDLKAWPLLNNCGISGRGTCEQYTATPGTESLFIYVFRDSTATTWLKVPLPEVEPSRISSYFVIARGVFGSYTMRLWMIARSEPAWSPRESFKGVTYSTPAQYSSVLTSGLLDPVQIGAPGYVGFYFYDPFGVGDSIVVDSISIGVYFK